MDKRYIGLSNGEWEEFEASSDAEATPEATGYEMVKEAETGREITNK